MAPRDRDSSLAEDWAVLRRQLPRLGVRVAAAALRVSEAELLATDCGRGTTRLAADWGRLVAELPRLGPVVAVTRNARALHEKRGEFGNVHVDDSLGLVLNGSIDLRLYLEHWHLGFARDDGRRQSLQFFDTDGTAVHKLFLDPGSDREAYRALVERHASPDQSRDQTVHPRARNRFLRLDEEIDVEGLRATWACLQDMHDFAELLRTFRVTRLQALRLAGHEFAHRVPRRAVRDVLRWVAAAGTPIMVVVESPGTTQIHTGPVRNVEGGARWLAVRDFGFHLRLRADRVASAWVVRKPTRDGTVTSLELFDGGGEPFALFFGERKPGLQESVDWRAVLGRLPALPTPPAGGVTTPGPDAQPPMPYLRMSR